MHDLFVLFGTLGGISLFGILGIIVGPIIAALFITIWEIYGKTFAPYLPAVGPLFGTDQGETPPEESPAGQGEMALENSPAALPESPAQPAAAVEPMAQVDRPDAPSDGESNRQSDATGGNES